MSRLFYHRRRLVPSALDDAANDRPVVIAKALFNRAGKHLLYGFCPLQAKATGLGKLQCVVQIFVGIVS